MVDSEHCRKRQPSATMALKDPVRAKSDANGGFWAYDAFANAAASHQDSKVAREAPEISHGNASSHPVPGHGGTLMLRGVGLAKVAPRKWRQDAGAVDEIATVFMEAAPHLMSEDGSRSGDAASKPSSPPGTPPELNPDDRTASFRSNWSSFRSTLSGTCGPSPFAGRLRSRLRRCTPARVERPLDWTKLRAVVRSESVAEEKLAEETNIGGGAVDINSGGAVFFCIFDGADTADTDESTERETVAVVKFCANRLAAQSEYFAFEIAKSLGVVAPTTRLFRKAAPGVVNGGAENTPPAGEFPGAPVPPADGREWTAALEAARRLSFPVVSAAADESDEAACPTVSDDVREDADAAEAFARCLDDNQAGLVMRYVRGKPLVPDDLRRALAADSKDESQTENAKALGRVFVLDMLLANPDRLPCSRLMWRGNPGNMLYGRADVGEGDDGAASKGGNKTVVVIDQAVPRRPPAMRARQDAKEVPPLTELLRNHSPTAREVFIESLGGAESLEAAGLDPDEIADRLTDSFRSGVEDAVDATAKLKGLFDSLARGLYETLKMLFEDLDDMRKETKAEKVRGGAGVTGSPETPAEPSPVKVLLEERRAAAAAAVDASPPRKQAAQVKAFDFPGVGGGAMVPKTLRMAGSPSGGDAEQTPAGLATRPENNAGLGDADKLVGGGIETPAKSSTASDAAPAPLARQGTMKLRKAQKEAKGSEAMGEWLVDWEDVMRDDKAQLKVRCGEWAARRGLNADMHTGFLDCSTGRDIVDCYELWVRLSHLIHRGAGIAAASETRCASLVGERLFLGGALVANAGHTLRALGVTHVLNCTDDLEDAHAGDFTYHRLPAKDVSEENLSVHFESANAFIAGALASDPGNSVLVHCFEGKSRSATIVAQYLMESTKTNLNTTLKGMKAAHPDTKPNEGFMRLLMAKEKALFGLEESSVSEKKVRGRGKPQMRSCPKCGARCGLSAESVKLHIKKAHPTMGM